ncbi:alpha/beta hydrolase [Marinobacterium sp. YM272]|uniref:alpha/beta hydrolase n=1 Tax=Marinobacterium sp. YM272 TaxID=3421654 RepID=UPI003D7F6ABF
MLSEFLSMPVSGECVDVNLRSAYFMKCAIYRPSNERRRDRVLVAVHGISRNYLSQAEAFRSLAERLGICLMAPLFDRERFPNYQRLAANPEQLRADLALSMLLLTWQSARMLPQLKVHLVGYSGGAQFAHRYAYLHPERVASLSVCSAGWYTLPDPDVSYPYGVKNWPEWLGEPRRNELAMLPMLALVGDQDYQRDSALRTNARLDRSQGKDRIERANRWVETINGQRSELGVSPPVSLELMQGQSHDFDASVKSGLMLPPLEQFIRNLGG